MSEEINLDGLNRILLNNSLLIDACKYGNYKKAVKAINDGADNYNEGLVCACRNNHYEIVKLLLDNGADDYNDALANAHYEGHTKLAILMLEKGADIDKMRWISIIHIEYLLLKKITDFKVYTYVTTSVIRDMDKRKCLLQLIFCDGIVNDIQSF